MALLRDFSIGTPRLLHVDSESSVVAAANEIGYPVVLKTAEHGIAHKSDHGNVLVKIHLYTIASAFGA